MSVQMPCGPHAILQLLYIQVDLCLVFCLDGIFWAYPQPMHVVTGAALAWGFLGERWSTLGWVGAFMIVGSSLAAQILTKDESKKNVA